MAGELAQIPVSQIAMVVSDLEKSVAAFHKLMGWGPWDIYEYRPPHFHDAYVRGEPANFTYIGAETQVGAVWIELLQPLEGQSIFKEWLERHGEGVHHLGYWAKTRDEADAIRRTFEQAGNDLLIEGWIDNVYFYYMDTKPTLIEVWTGDLDALKASRTYP